MNTNQPTIPDDKSKGKISSQEDTVRIITLKQPSLMDFSDEDDDEVSSVSNLVGALNSVDLNSPEASQNVHSISDNNGGRIELNLDKVRGNSNK